MTVAESADRFAAWRRRVHPVFATVGTALMVLLVGAIVIPHGSASGIPGDLLVGVYMPSVAALVVLIVGRSKTLDVLAIRLPFLQAAAWIMISTAVLVTLATAVLKLTGHSFSEDSYLMRTGAFPVWAVEQIAAATTFPFMEEVVFRGVIQTELKKRFGAIAAVLVTSTLFGFYHYDGTLEIARIGVLCCAGLVFGIVRERTDSLGAPIAVHGLYNAAISCLEFVA